MMKSRLSCPELAKGPAVQTPTLNSICQPSAGSCCTLPVAQAFFRQCRSVPTEATLISTSRLCTIRWCCVFRG
ncbi:hypothetical protein BDW68DRAFT_159716 [Aspergillus falconensis]